MAATAKQLAAWHKAQDAQKKQDAHNAPYFDAYFKAHPEYSFTPYVTPTKAPAGSYDPAYDAQLENANQGFGWASQDYDTNKLALGNDYTLATTRLGEDAATAAARRSGDYATSQGYLSTNHQASLGDLLTARTRGAEDYGVATAGLQRNYTNLGSAQTQNARAAGVAEGGALVQALGKRSANQAIDQTALDTTNSRFMADNTTATNRENTSFGQRSSALDLSYQRGNEDQALSVGRQTADLGTSYFRNNAKLDTGFERAGIQNDTFNRQINTQTLGIAAQNGSLPTKPANEKTYKGVAYREEVFNGKKYARLANGRLVPVSQLSKYV